MGDNTQGRLSPKQDAFALAFFETGNAAEAYRRAYGVETKDRDSWVYVEACQLLDNPKIAIRLESLQAEAERMSLFTRKAAYDEYEDARQLAKKEKNPSAAVAAINGKVKLFGLEAPTKSKVDHTSSDGSLGSATDEQIDARIAALTAKMTGAKDEEAQ